MYNPVTSRLVITLDAIGLGRMYNTRVSHNLDKKMPVVSVPINMNDDPKNYYNVLGINKDEEKVLEDSHNELSKFVNVGAGIDGGFSNTQEL
jgi:hypothetical protein